MEVLKVMKFYWKLWDFIENYGVVLKIFGAGGHMLCYSMQIYEWSSTFLVDIHILKRAFRSFFALSFLLSISRFLFSRYFYIFILYLLWRLFAVICTKKVWLKVIEYIPHEKTRIRLGSNSSNSGESPMPNVALNQLAITQKQYTAVAHAMMRLKNSPAHGRLERRSVRQPEFGEHWSVLLIPLPMPTMDQ
jgi:predicted membrane protein